MAVLATSLTLLESLGVTRSKPSDVLGMRHRLKVGRTYAPLDLAEVIDFKAIRDRTIECLICEDVGVPMFAVDG